jgi:hypothetical protein
MYFIILLPFVTHCRRWQTEQGCQIYFHTKKSQFGFGSHLEPLNVKFWYMFSHLVHFSAFWYVVPKKSGNPETKGSNLLQSRDLETEFFPPNFLLLRL